MRRAISRVFHFREYKNKDLYFSDSDYLPILDLAYEVIQALKGGKSDIYKIYNCQQLAFKIYFHGASILMLSRRTKVDVPISTGGSDFVDFASIFVLTRTIFETYLKLFEVFFLPGNEDERRFRFHLWELAGYRIRENVDDVQEELSEKYEEAKRDLDEIRNEIKQTDYYRKLSIREQGVVIQKGKLENENRQVIARLAGFGSEKFKQMYQYLSSYVHFDGLSGIQISEAKSKKEQLEYSKGSIRVVMIVLSKLIKTYSQAFTASRLACDLRPDQYKRALFWAGIAENMP